MLVLIRLFWNICLLKRGPQDVPYSVFLLAGMLTIDMLIGLVIYLIPDALGTVHSTGRVFIYLLANNLSFMAAIYVILSLHGRTARSLQTISAMLGVDIILNLMHTPILLLASSAKQHPAISLLFVLGAMAIFVWEMVAYSHILKQALAISMLRAGGYALLLFVLYLVINYLSFPVSQ